MILALSIEAVLMKHSQKEYNTVISNLQDLYHCEIVDCYEQPEYLQTVLKKMYGEKYSHIIDEIRSELGGLSNENEISLFLSCLEN